MNRGNPSEMCGDRSVFLTDLQADGEPEREFNPGIAEKLPRKNVASGAIVRDMDGRILFLTPAYKPFLEIPGGLTEDDESPLAACRREVREELGIDLPITTLLLIDWMPTQGVWRDSVQLIFDGGTLTAEQIATLKPAEGEIDKFEFLTMDQARDRLRPSMARRVETAIDALDENGRRYAEFGRTIE